MLKRELYLIVLEEETGISYDKMKEIIGSFKNEMRLTKARIELDKEKTVITKEEAAREFLEADGNTDVISNVFKKIFSSTWSYNNISNALKVLREKHRYGDECAQIFTDIILRVKGEKTMSDEMKELALSKSKAYACRADGLAFVGYIILNDLTSNRAAA